MLSELVPIVTGGWGFADASYLALVALLSAMVLVRGRDYEERLRWHLGQKWLERFMNEARLIGPPQRGQGSPPRPYAFKECAK